MSELKTILNIYRIKKELIRSKYQSVMPYFNLFSCQCKSVTEEYVKKIKELAEKESAELQELENEKTQELKNYYEKLEEKISKASNRELLEEVYRKISEVEDEKI